MTPTNKAVREALEYYANGTHIKQGKTDLSVENGAIAKQALSLLDAETAGVGGDDDRQNALNCLEAAIKVINDGCCPSVNLLLVAESYIKSITTPTNKAVREALEAFDNLVKRADHDANGINIGGEIQRMFMRHDVVRTIRAALSKPPVTGIPATDLQPDADKTGVGNG